MFASVGGDVALLLRRAGFGPTSAELAAARQAGYQATLAVLTQPPGPDIGATGAPFPDLGQDSYARPPKTPADKSAADAVRTQQARQLSQWWLDRMTCADQQATEKLLFFWHGHWATSIGKVNSPQLMLAQHRTLRAATDFRAMAHAMIADPALIVWLDGQVNVAGAPNENLAREFFELFTLGVGNYTETDVKEAARALTGWRIDLPSARAYLDPTRHDAGTKTILGSSGTIDAAGLVELVLRQPTCARFIAARLWYRYGSSTRPLPARVRDAMVAAFPQPMAMLRVLLASDEFQATRDTMVKQPIEWLVGAARQLGLRLATLPADTFTYLLQLLYGMGQAVFAPPTVGGWPSEAAWLTSAAAQSRLSLAHTLADLSTIDHLTPESAAALLGVGKWSKRTLSALHTANSSTVLLALALASPDYLVT